MENKEFLDVSELDVVEESIWKFDSSILRRLLQDKTTKKNILWATKDYESLGPEYGETCEINPELITGENTLLIQPRSAKAKEEQVARTRDKAEVFTPSWVCNCQNNLVDTEWFGRSEVFNTETDEGYLINFFFCLIYGSPAPGSFRLCEILSVNPRSSTIKPCLWWPNGRFCCSAS